MLKKFILGLVLVTPYLNADQIPDSFTCKWRGEIRINYTTVQGCQNNKFYCGGIIECSHRDGRRGVKSAECPMVNGGCRHWAADNMAAACYNNWGNVPLSGMSLDEYDDYVRKQQATRRDSNTREQTSSIHR